MARGAAAQVVHQTQQWHRRPRRSMAPSCGGDGSTLCEWPPIFLARQGRLISRRLLMHYLVTGGAGFIGSNTVDELVRRGHSVTVLDDLSTGSESNLAAVRGKVELIVGSIT